LEAPNRRNIATYYIGWELPADVVSSPQLQSFQILNFYFSSLFVRQLFVEPT